MEAKKRIIVALDVPDMEQACLLVEELAWSVGYFKIGLQLISAGLHKEIEQFIADCGCWSFLDGKFCDIPNTVGAAAKNAAISGFQMFNVHASCGIKAMQAAVANKGDAKVLAVTVLTSLGEDETNLIFGAPVKAKVLQFARDAKLAGVDGLICSPKELKFLKQFPELEGLAFVTPGIRPKWAAKGDQVRITTPRDAIKAGADYLVIGRPITKPPESVGSPKDAAEKIAEEIREAEEEKHSTD